MYISNDTLGSFISRFFSLIVLMMMTNSGINNLSSINQSIVRIFIVDTVLSSSYSLSVKAQLEQLND